MKISDKFIEEYNCRIEGWKNTPCYQCAVDDLMEAISFICDFLNEKHTGSYKYGSLALGTRFKYRNDTTVWVKISVNTVAKWDEKQKTDSWIGQQICSFDENHNMNIYVDVL